MDNPQRFARLADELADRPGVTLPEPGRRSFGASALKVDGSIFAMLCDDRLVVKLPADRVAALCQDGTGGPFASAKGTPMREWATVLTDDDRSWRDLAEEALAFVGR